LLVSVTHKWRLEILKNNGMKTPNPNQGKTSSKKKRMWKNLMESFSESFDSSNSNKTDFG
jgi:hypothetical protein